MHKLVQVTRGKILIIYVSMVSLLAFSLMFSSHLVSRFEENQREQARQAMVPVCTYVKAQRDIYLETPPSTPTGKRLQESTERLYFAFQCDRLVP